MVEEPGFESTISDFTGFASDLEEDAVEVYVERGVVVCLLDSPTLDFVIRGSNGSSKPQSSTVEVSLSKADKNGESIAFSLPLLFFLDPLPGLSSLLFPFLFIDTG